MAVVDAIDEPPTLMYLADVVAIDDFLDLAVVQIGTDIDGNQLGELALPYIALGDSSSVELGDSLRILGFPGIGGDTITFTRGAVSGFVAERDVDDTRAWIKTDATIAGGNSGGVAANEAGELVGVPTTAGAGDAATTDCRVIEDTNGDGFIDETDSCIPIGGFINGLRPINLASALIADAVDADSIRPVSPQISPTTDFSTDDVVIHDVYFSPDVNDDDQPTEVVIALPSGAEKVCAFWTYTGMQDGVSYDAIWRFDGEADSDASFLDDVWAGGESGEWWVCVVNDAGVADGLFEFEFTVDGEFLASESIFVGGDRRPVSITLDNQATDRICYVQISPTLSGYWGNRRARGDRGDRTVQQPRLRRAGHGPIRHGHPRLRARTSQPVVGTRPERRRDPRPRRLTFDCRWPAAAALPCGYDPTRNSRNGRRHGGDPPR